MLERSLSELTTTGANPSACRQVDKPTIDPPQSNRCQHLGVYLAHARSPLQLARSILEVMRGHWQGTHDLDVVSANNLVIDGRQRELLVAIDGEVATLDLPRRYRIRPKALRIVTPHHGSDLGGPFPDLVRRTARVVYLKGFQCAGSMLD